MATKTFDLASTGAPGLVKDRPGYALDVSAFTSAVNVRFADGMVQNFPGWQDICLGDLLVDNAYYMQMLPLGDLYYWAVAGATDGGVAEICVTAGSEKTDVTPDISPVITPADQWSGGFFNGISVLNNGPPNYPITLLDPAAVDAKYVDLPFDAGNSWREEQIQCGIMRPFKNFLVAFDIYKNAARYPYMVKWSDATDPGFLPASWDETDPTTLAGENILAETGGHIVDFAPLGDLGMIYKEDSVWSMSLVGGAYVFRFRQALPTIGCLAPNCVTEFRGKHFVLMDGDVVVHNGQTANSIIEKKIKNYLFRTMDTDSYRTSFVVRHDRASEIWVCYPGIGAVLPNVALVWNFEDDTWTVRDLPENTAWMTIGVDILGQESVDLGDPWDGQDPRIWDSSQGIIWTDREFNPIIRTLVSMGRTGIQKQDDSNLYGGTVRRCYAERTGMPLEGQDRRFLVNRVYPLLEGSGPIQISIGTQTAPNAPVNWDGPFDFVPGEDNFLNPRIEGTLLSWRIESYADVSWALQGWRVDYTPLGRQ